MTNELTHILVQYLLVVFSCCVFFYLGKILLKAFPIISVTENNKWLHAYAAMVLGIVFTVLIYSMILTNGKTINIIILPILLGLFFVMRKDNCNNNRILFKDRPISFLIIVPFLFIALFHLFPESEFKQNDSVYYLQISQSFNKYGQENNFGGANLFGQPFAGTVPYHYFEFWLNAVLLRCFNQLLQSIQLLRFVCYGIISTIGLLGIFALAKNTMKQPLSIVQKALCICFIFYLPSFLTLHNFLKPIFIYAFDSNVIERPNLRTLYLFLPGILITIGQKNKWQTLFWIVCATAASVLNFAVLSAAVILFCIFNLLFYKENRRQYVILFSAILIIAILYLSFNYVTASNLKRPSTEINNKTLLAYFARYWKIILFSSATSILNCLFVPLVLLFVLKTKNKNISISIIRKNKTIILFACAIVLSAIGFARTLNFTDNAYQFAFIGYSVSAILFLILLLKAFQKIEVKNWVYYVICMLFIISFLIPRFFFHPTKYTDIFTQNGSYVYGGKKFTADYLEKILSVFPPNSNINGAFWADAHFYDSVSYYSNRNPNAYMLPSGYILSNKLKYNYAVCLSDSASIMFKIDTTQKVGYNYLKAAVLCSPFYLFPYQQPYNINLKRLSFIKKYKLQYIILTKNADSTIISKLPILKQFQDANTGERFYLIGESH